VSELVLDKTEMRILLNHLPSKIMVDYPLNNEQILTSEAEEKYYNLDIHLDPNPLESDSELWNNEKPNYSDYRECFLASNLLTFQNIDTFRQEYKTYTNLRKKVVFAPDTNLFYYKFISSNHVRTDEILLVDSIQKEINHRLNKKFTPKELGELKQIVRYQKNLLDEFYNGRHKLSRLTSTLALQEYLEYCNQVYATVHGSETGRDKEENDKIFVQAVRDYRSDSNTFPVVLTSDKMLCDVCELFGLNYFRFELPERIFSQSCSPKQLCDLICNLAGVLGVVQVNKLLIFGEFRDKTGFGEYKIRFLSGKVPVELERDLEICRELLKLKIEF